MKVNNRQIVRGVVLAMALMAGAAPLASADIIINVLAINGAGEKRETPIRFVLPPDLKAEDIADTDGLTLQYDVNEGAYVAEGSVALEPKATKAFRIKVKDVWQVTPQDVEGIKKEVEEAYDKLGKVGDQAKTDELRRQLLDRLEFVVAQQTTNNDTVEKRIDAFRIYEDRLTEIKRDALSVDYWRSDPDEVQRTVRLVRLIMEVENPPGNAARMIEQKQYLPVEVKPEYIINREDFQIRFDEEKQKPYLYKEEEFTPGQRKRYEITIKDVWYIRQNEINYLKQRAKYALDFLKESRYEKTAQYLYDRAGEKLTSIETSQGVQREIYEHISAFRLNSKVFDGARKDVDDLEKLVAIYREELEKTKVKNVLQKVRSLKSVAEVSDSIFKKKPKMNTTWSMIGWVLLFVGIYTVIHFAIWGIRSAGRKEEEKKSDETKK
jgi:hypothetical protein